jgi:AAA15 family ATPase/GTPase
MLTNFKVRNFRNFDDWFTFNLKTSKNYEFNSTAVENDNVLHSIIYGKNGCGKSNLGLALLDLSCHLNDSNILSSLRSNYLNANSESDDIAEFEYEFEFDNDKVTYKYGKSDCSTTTYETLTINSVVCIHLDRRNNTSAKYNLLGAESLKNDFSSSNISAVKYLGANALLDKNNTNLAFEKFLDFVNGMVFFRTLNRHADFHGQNIDVKRLSEIIISENKLKDFEDFLNQAGIKCKLIIEGPTDNKVIHFDLGKKSLEFSQVASTGTLSLGIFYYWWLKLEVKSLTFAFIDEFDAYYHYELSKLIVKKLSDINAQTILTTHNLSIMTNDLLRPDCYFLLADKQYPFYELVDKDLRKAHNLEKIFKGLENEE